MAVSSGWEHHARTRKKRQPLCSESVAFAAGGGAVRNSTINAESAEIAENS
jgi:hypothetical protein